MENKLSGRKPEDLFFELIKKCQKLGIPSDDISKLSSIKKLRSKNNQKGEKILFYFLASFISICALIIGIGSQPLTLIFARILFYIHDYETYEIELEKCVVDMPPMMQNMFLPPFDCSKCRNLTEIERVTNISLEDFEKRFAYTSIPVIVRDATANWTALETFSFDFFRQLYLGDRKEIEEGEWECQFFPYQTEFTSLAEVLTMSKERAKEPWYIGWSNCDGKAGGVLRKHYRRPYFLPLESESTNIDWIFMGTPGHGAHMHIDHVANPSWQAQLKGTKLWNLEPVPECYNECHNLEAVVHPGEVIVFDANNWYHKTLITGDDLSIVIGAEYD